MNRYSGAFRGRWYVERHHCAGDDPAGWILLPLGLFPGDALSYERVLASRRASLVAYSCS